MDDGGISNYNQTILHTRAFTKEEVILLQNALEVNFELRTRLEEKQTNQWVIYIPVRQRIPLNKIVGSYMHETMLYKIKK
jgi:LAGLIDADG DNA endonuclease family